MGWASFASPLSSVLDIGGSFIQNDWSKRSAQRSMDFSKMMSDTSYQRGVADLRAAGLNPMLAYDQGGASSPTGNMSSSMFDAGDIGNSARDMMRVKQEMKTKSQEIKESDSRVDLNLANTRVANQNALKFKFDTDVAEAMATVARGVTPTAKFAGEGYKNVFDIIRGIDQLMPSKVKDRFRFTPDRDKFQFRRSGEGNTFYSR